MRLTIALLVCAVLLVPAGSDARTWLVRQDGTGDCTAIQACCNSAGYGDTVLVAAGVYNEKVALYYGIKLFSEDGPSVTVITPPSIDVPAVLMSSPSVVDGFTVRGKGIGMGYVGGVQISGGTLRNCVIVNCTAQGIDNSGAAGGIYAGGSAVIEANTIVNNGHWVTAGGIYCAGTFKGRIEHNIIALNTGYGVYCEFPSYPTLVCNDVWGNAGGNYGGGWCGDFTGYNGNVSVDPLFCDSAHSDYRLRGDSPCVNAAGCGRIGVFGAACGPTGVTAVTWGRVKVLFR